MNESDWQFYKLIENLENLPEYAVNLNGVFAEWQENIPRIAQKKNDWKLYDLLQYSESLPKYSVDTKSIVANWEKKNPFVGKVMRGEASFEKTISSFAEENSRLYRSSYKEGICNSPEFEKTAKEIKEKFSDILDLSDLTKSFDIRKNIWDDLKFSAIYVTVMWGIIFLFFCLITQITEGASILKSWPWLLALILPNVMFCSFLQFFHQKRWLKDRREHAKKILDQAWWLDHEFLEIRRRKD
jgi:hypothetical protein